ncbi:type II secretion system major pseudopilin GspG [Rubrimonas cliftonensis]|uniref:Type II secretion system core protein G n=1 Tax=Rubrimonas cliftonensis TaxID=89524 RepID=A0A1H3WPQ6_9RHOB|nr:type II secretion system major pseudopilin GspG [Rubrimonas cliftonensis]SDZ89167.1 general secretion pathway protein G [Rubrimonas cliftonensis]
MTAKPPLSRSPDRQPAPPPRRARADAGFTLLELLVVVTILVLLTAAVGTVALNFLGGAKQDAARIQIGQIEAGLDLYRLDMGRYPTEREGLEALVSAPTGAARWAGPYLRKRDALEDPWGAPFTYAAPGQGGAPYDLLSLGSDGAEGGEGEAADVRNR